MNGYNLNTTDSLALYFEGPGDPLEVGGSGLDSFLDAVETHAGEMMLTSVHGKRSRKYSRAAIAKACAETRTDLVPRIYLKRPSSPEVLLTLNLGHHPSYNQFAAFLTVLPFAFFEESGRALERSQNIIEMVRAWASHYPVTHAVAHSLADRELSNHTGRTSERTLGRPLGPHDWVHAAFWLNVFGKELVDALGRARVLSTPAHLVEELPTGAVLLVTRPTVADFASEEARLAQARAIAHLRPDFQFDAVLRELREHSAALAPVEPRFDPDIAALLLRVVDFHPIWERQRKIAEMNAYRPPRVDEWLSANAAPPSNVADPKAAIEHYSELAENLVIMRHVEVPSVSARTIESLTDIDFYFWLEKFPEFYAREKVDTQAVPAVGAYLGEVLVRQLGGRWVPRRNLDEAQVIVGPRAWLPFVRARHYMQTQQSLLDFSLTKLYREAERQLKMSQTLPL